MGSRVSGRPSEAAPAEQPKRMGRPPGTGRPPEARTKPRSVRLTDARWAKLQLLGSAWLAAQIDRAEV